MIGLDHNLDLLKTDKHKPTQTFLESVLENSYIPCITRPTRNTHSSATLIDNILVSRDIYNNITSGIDISDLSDHLPCIMTCPLINDYKKGSIRIHKKKLDEKNVVNIANDLKIDWSWLEETTSVNKCYQLFHNHLMSVVNYYIVDITLDNPCKQIIREPLLTKGIISANKKQLTLYKAWLQNKNANNHERYKQYQDTLRKIKKRCKFEYYNVQFERFKQNSKKLWGIINEVCGKCNDKSMSLNYISVDGVELYSSNKITAEFAEFFPNIGARYSKKVAPSNLGIVNYLNKIPRNSKSIFLTPCTPQEIRTIVSSLKNKHSSGHDGITNIL